MRYGMMVLLIVGLLLTGLPVAAQTGYIQTDTAPEAGMFPLGTTFSLLVLNAQNGQFGHHPARIEHYIQWVNPARPAEYYVTLTDWPGAFFFFNRESLEQWVTLQRLVVGLLEKVGKMPIPAIDLSYLIQGQPADAVPDVTKPLGELETGINDVLAGDVGFEQVNLGAEGEVTISGGAITITRTHHTVDTEGNAATDDLVTINGGTAGDMLLLRLADASRTVVVNHNVGNIFLTNEQDFALDSANKSLALFFTGSKWTNIGGGGVGGSRRLFAQTADVVIGNTTTQTSLFGSGVGSLTLPANTLSVGECIRIKITGIYKSHAANTLFEVQVKSGGLTKAYGNGNPLVLSQASQHFEIEILMTLRAVGATGTIGSGGQATFDDDTGGSGKLLGIEQSTTGIDTTIDQALDVTWQWTTAHANNEITARQALVEVI